MIKWYEKELFWNVDFMMCNFVDMLRDAFQDVIDKYHLKVVLIDKTEALLVASKYALLIEKALET